MLIIMYFVITGLVYLVVSHQWMQHNRLIGPMYLFFNIQKMQQVYAFVTPILWAHIWGLLFTQAKVRRMFCPLHEFSTNKNLNGWKMFCVMPHGGSIVLMLLDLVRRLVNNIQCWTWWPLSFVIPTRLVPDNFEVKDKKRKMYPWGLWNSCEEPQKQHFIRGTIQNGNQQYVGEFKWEALCEGKAKEICLVPGPFLLFTNLSWVTLMWTRWLKNKAAWLDLIPVENRLVGWVGGKGMREEECSFRKETQENHISASVSICQGKAGRVE